MYEVFFKPHKNIILELEKQKVINKKHKVEVMTMMVMITTMIISSMMM